MIQRILLFLVLVTLAPFAVAQSGGGERRVGYSETEKTGFAFYRLADKPPPFEQWVRASDNYMFAKPSAKREILRSETERLTRAYASYMPDDDLLVLRTTVRVRVPNAHERASYEKMGVRKPVQIVTEEIRENYFPVQVGGMWIALVANGLEDYLFMSMDDDAYKRLVERLGIESVGSQRQAVLELRLRPRAVDLTRPLSLDGIDAWLMLGDIATISLWRKQGDGSAREMVWEQTQPWYTPRQQRELMDLFNR